MPRPKLKPHQEQLLRELLARRDPVPADEVDGRVLRPLRALKLVVLREGRVVPTGAARALLGAPAPADVAPAEREAATLSDAQHELLWSLARRSRNSPALADHLDGRVLRGLLERGMLEERGGWVHVTEAGRQAVKAAKTARRRTRRGGELTPSESRAEMIWKALELLETAIPTDAEIQLRGGAAYADDVLLALWRKARELQERP